MIIPYDELLLEALLFENQEQYLIRKYPEVSPELIQQAIELDRRNAEKLVFGLQTGAISELGPDAVERVANLDPFAKVSRKSEADLAYEAEIRAAKQISPKYWQWIIRVRKTNPDAEFEAGIFHYLEDQELDTADIIDKSLEEINADSARWHQEQFANQEAHGTYIKQLKDGIFTYKQFTWVPVPAEDSGIEGAKMSNCIGRHVIPQETAANGKPPLRIYSCRNMFNNPHVSLSMVQETSPLGKKYWRIREIKGKANVCPPHTKYIPATKAFIEFLMTKQVSPSIEYSDFARVMGDVTPYIKYVKEPITEYSRDIINALPDDQLNRLILDNGFTVRGIDSTILNRLSTETIIELLNNKNLLLFRQESLPKLIKEIIKTGKLTEEKCMELAQTIQSRSITMILNAIYRPQEFIKELSAINIEDLYSLLPKYADAIEAYQGYDPLFKQLFLQYGGEPTNKSAELQMLLSKLPPQDLMDIIRHLVKIPDSAYLKNNLVNFAVSRLIHDIRNFDIQQKLQVLEFIPANYEYNVKQAQDIVYSTSLEDMPLLYKAAKANKKLFEPIGSVIRSIKDKLGPEFDIKDPILPKPSGMTPDVLEFMDKVLETDDLDTLRALRRQTKSRGVKILIDRKIQRLARFQNDE